MINEHSQYVVAYHQKIGRLLDAASVNASELAWSMGRMGASIGEVASALTRMKAAHEVRPAETQHS